MVCSTCGITMKTENGSEKGEMRDDYYFTSEIKVCLQCEKRILESYSAEIIKTIIKES